jgi:hypothetical protein
MTLLDLSLTRIRRCAERLQREPSPEAVADMNGAIAQLWRVVHSEPEKPQRGRLTAMPTLFGEEKGNENRLD